MTEQEREKSPVDVNALIQEVLRESYLQTTEDLRFYAEKVRYFNQRKKAIREYLSALREFKAKVMSATRERGVQLCPGNEKDVAILAELFDQNAQAYKVGEVEHELGIPDRVPQSGTKNMQVLENEIRRWEEKLATLGDDAQLANVDLQNVLQKQQQTLQMMSNISKMLHDTAMAVIRKMGG
ncbi:MAG TPA: hypothetical protein VIB00_17055 [Pyrinomonadaceae bacterium]|jgi:hypothetical protein